MRGILRRLFRFNEGARHFMRTRPEVGTKGYSRVINDLSNFINRDNDKR
mgnify:CR=1 FL=1